MAFLFHWRHFRYFIGEICFRKNYLASLSRVILRSVLQSQYFGHLSSKLFTFCWVHLGALREWLRSLDCLLRRLGLKSCKCGRIWLGDGTFGLTWARTHGISVGGKKHLDREKMSKNGSLRLCSTPRSPVALLWFLGRWPLGLYGPSGPPQRI